MEGLIPVVNKLQDVFGSIGVEKNGVSLPQIVVVGAQSSGKSSVMENIIGRDFLPRGTNMVTRRPLILQCIPFGRPVSPPRSTGSLTPEGESPRTRARRALAEARPAGSRSVSPAPAQRAEDDWVEFLHLPDKRFTDFAEVRAEIERETDRVVPKNRVSPLPITLKFYSPRAIPLALVDLPGLIKIPTGGQPSDIEAQIRTMVLQYIAQPNSIILAITSANTDLANSDALQLAKEVDPTCSRTLGVLTKLDLMDRGTDATDILAGRVLPLPLGFCAVVCRAQEDIVMGKSIGEALVAESEFFASRPAYRPFGPKLGTANLARTLNKLLLAHIRDRLPEVKRHIAGVAQQAREELERLGDSPGDSPATRGAALLSALTQLSNEFRDTIDGKLFRLSQEGPELPGGDLYGGARIAHIFHEVFRGEVDRVDPAQELTPFDIHVAIRNATGTRPALFVPDACFEVLVKSQIRRLEEPCQNCVHAVYDELAAILSALASSLEVQRYPVLRYKVAEIFNDLLRKHVGPTTAMVANIIRSELAYINMAHPDFIGWNRAVSLSIGKREDKEKGEEKEKAANGGEMSGNGSASNPAPSSSSQGSSSVVKEVGGASVSVQRVGAPVLVPPRPAPAALQAGPMAKPGVGPKPPPAPEEERGLLPWIKGALGATPPKPAPSTELRPADPNPGRGPGWAEVAHGMAGPALRPQEALTTREQQLTEIISTLLGSYFGVVKKNVQDSVPKACMAFLVNAAKEGLHAELVSALYREDRFEELLAEEPETATRRREQRELLEACERAMPALQQIRDFRP